MHGLGGFCAVRGGGGGLLPSGLREAGCWVGCSQSQAGVLLESGVGEAKPPEGGEAAVGGWHCVVFQSIALGCLCTERSEAVNGVREEQ